MSTSESSMSNGKVNMIKFLVLADSIDINDLLFKMCDVMEFTEENIRENNCEVIHWACEKNKLEFLKYLRLKYSKLNVNDTRSDNNYSLRIACENGHIDVIKELFDHWGLNSDDTASLALVIKNGEHVHDFMMKHLKLDQEPTQNNKYELLHNAAEYGDLKFINKLLNMKLIEDKDLVRVMKVAGENNHMNIVEQVMKVMIKMHNNNLNVTTSKPSEPSKLKEEMSVSDYDLKQEVALEMINNIMDYSNLTKEMLIHYLSNK